MGEMTDADASHPSNLGGSQRHPERASTSRSPRSYGSYEAGESSTAGSPRHDAATGTTLAHSTRHGANRTSSSSSASVPSLEFGNSDHKHEAQRRRRSHKPRPSGGFLLSNTIANGASKTNTAGRGDGRTRSRTPVDSRESRKGKSRLNNSDKTASTIPSNVGLGVDDEDMVDPSEKPPSARRSSNAQEERHHSQGARSSSRNPSLQPNPAPLDVDSTQIVNMALNLSESRRLSSRRIVSGPVPPRLGPVPDSSAGGSLKQHLQQQRKSSRNISPRPERGLKSRNVSMSSPRINSPLQPSFEQEGSYTYHFSPSTLNRALKAKEYLELMAQYRRLLQFVPPLEQGPHSRPSTSSPPASPASAEAPSGTLSGSQQLTLGRPYNPLQYIRNRKVRARERKTVDGETQGFADVPKVTDWVDEVATSAATSAFLKDPSLLPSFPGAHENAEQPQSASNIARPISAGGKLKRPRVDWSIDPADMLADVYWLEQDDHKYLIEDRHYSKILPRKVEALRPPSHQANESSKSAFPNLVARQSEDGRPPTGTELHDAKAAKMEMETSLVNARERARQKLQDLKGTHHKHSLSSHSHHDFLRFRRSSLSDTSDSESDRRRRERGGTVSADSRDLLDKQVMEMLAKEAREEQKETQDDTTTGYFKPLPSLEQATPDQISKAPQRGHSRRGSRVEALDREDKKIAGRVPQGSPIGSGRPSLEVPGYNYRASLDSSRPQSPDTRPFRRRSARIPTIGMDLSPPDSRPGSPVRNPFSKVKSIFHDRSRSRSRERDDHVLKMNGKEDKLESPVEKMEPLNISAITAENIASPERPRSKSPAQIVSRTTGDSHKSHRSMGSIRFKSDEQLGLKGIFKGGAKIDDMIRGGVSKVTDFIWKKDSDLEEASSDTSSDESDVEPRRGRLRDSITLSRNSSRRPREGRHGKTYLDVMPPFKSASDSINKPTSQDTDIYNHAQTASPPPSNRSPRFDQLKPPRIDIRRASPETSELERMKSRQSLDSDASDTDVRSRDSSGYTDRPRKTSQELNNILALPQARAQNPRPHRSSVTQPPGGRHWSISDRTPSSQRAQISKREVARLRTLILCSGIKAMEISRRANEPHPIFALDNKAMGLPWTDIGRFVPEEKISLSVPQTELYPATAQVLSDNIERSIHKFETTATKFASETTPELQRRIDSLHSRVATDLIEMTRRAADEADEVSRDIVDSQRLKVQSVVDTMDKMLRRRRRRFRWVRRAGWLAVEWVLVGFMWYVWFIVMVARVFLGAGRGIVGVVKWLLWL